MSATRVGEAPNRGDNAEVDDRGMRMRPRNAGVAAATAVLLVMGSCSAVDTTVTSTTAVASATSPTTPTSSSSSTTSQAPPGPTQDVRALAGYLASLYEIDADLAEDQAGPLVSDDMQYEIATLENAVARITELDPSPLAAQLQQDSIDVLVRFADVFRTFAEIGATATEANAEELLDAVMGDISAVASDMLDARSERDRMAGGVLAVQGDDPDAWFIVQMLTIQAEATPAIENVVAIVTEMFSDPDIEIEDLAVAIGEFAPIVDAWQKVEAPPRFESLRRRSEEVLSAVLGLVADLLDGAQQGEGSTDEAESMALAIELSNLSLKTQLLEIERARAVAAILRELSE